MKIKLLPTDKEFTISMFSENYNLITDTIHLDITLNTADSLTALKDDLSGAETVELLLKDTTVTFSNYSLSTINRTYTENGEDRTMAHFKYNE